MTALLLAVVLLAPAAQAKTRKAVKARAARSGAQAASLIEGGCAALERKEYSVAINAFTKAARARGDSGSYYWLGYAYYQRGFMAGDPDRADKQDAQETINAYTTALALDPELATVAQPYKLYHSLALSYETLGNYEKAIDAYKKAFQSAPHKPMIPLYAARLRFRMNDLAKSANNLELALRNAKEQGQVKQLASLVAADPKFSMMLANQAHQDVLRQYDPTASAAAAPAQPAGSVAVAATGYGIASAGSTMRDSVRGTAPSDTRVEALRAQDKDVLDALSSANDEYKFRRFQGAIKAYNDALSLNQNSGILNPTQLAFIHERIGTSYNKLGQSEEAIKALRKCVQTAPMDSAAHYQLALAYSVLGRYQESVHALAETFRNAPSTGELKRYLLLSKTDTELEPVRDLSAYKAMLEEHRPRSLAAR